MIGSHLYSAIIMLPASLLAASLVYLPIFFVRRKRNPVFVFARHAADYIFLGCCAMLSQVVFGWGSVSPDPGKHFINLSLFKAFWEAAISGNEIVSSQILLNILMFIPLGFLLPVVFPKRLNSYLSVSFVILAVTVMIEAMQYFIGRVADIDDVITNFSGGLCGFSLYVLLYIRFKDKPSFNHICTGRLRLPNHPKLISIGIIAVTFLTPLAANTALFLAKAQ